MNDEARQVIALLRLAPLPQEGGFFRQTWKGEAGSAIYFLLTETDFSALHRLTGPEVWHFYAGDPVEHIQLDDPAGSARVTRLGANVLASETPQLVVPGGAWQGARIAVGADLARGWALVGCTLAPPWDESQFELGLCGSLLEQFPAASEHILALTRSD